MSVREELHRLVDGLDVHDAKRRLHVLVAEMDEQTVRQILGHIEKLQQRRLEKWGFECDGREAAIRGRFSETWPHSVLAQSGCGMASISDQIGH
jgi:hypothetical protein